MFAETLQLDFFACVAKASNQDGGDSSICCTCAGTRGGFVSDSDIRINN